MGSDAPDRSVEWLGALDRSAYGDLVVEQSDRLADAARSADWDGVLGALTTSPLLGPNAWRVGGTSWFTPLHQAAWHGADARVVEELLRLGAWRSLREASGKRPVDLARERGHEHLADLLAVPGLTDAEVATYTSWDEHLRRLVEERTQALPPLPLRHVPTEVVALESFDTLWFPIPGMYGGFAISTYRRRLCVESWSRVVGGSGQAHVITASGCVLVEEGFV